MNSEVMDISKIGTWLQRAIDWLSVRWNAGRPRRKKALELVVNFLLALVATIQTFILWFLAKAGCLWKMAASFTREFLQKAARRPISIRSSRWLRYAAIALLALMIGFCLLKLGDYVYDYLASRRISAELREAYYQALEEERHAPVTPTPSPTPESTPAVSPAPTFTPVPSAAPTATQRVSLEDVQYPENPYLLTNSRFRTLRRQNSDIIGWLTIPGVIDEAVVQRDNTYDLRRDYLGYHNDNGAIFLKESCRLNTRPYTMMLFGHNMKSGAMFGDLRSYEDACYYRSNAFVTFDTLYEDGRYVIFAAGTLSQNSSDRNFVDTIKLCSSIIAWRSEAIEQLKRNSRIFTSIGVTADDQLLLLVTCTGNADERRYVAARRIREDETEAALLRLVKVAQ